MVTSFRTDLHHNFTVSYDTFLSQLSERIGKLLTESSTKRHVLYDKYCEKYPLSVEYSDLHHVFSNLCP